jgi:hypothetical protein
MVGPSSVLDRIESSGVTLPLASGEIDSRNSMIEQRPGRGRLHRRLIFQTLRIHVGMEGGLTWWDGPPPPTGDGPLL